MADESNEWSSGRVRRQRVHCVHGSQQASPQGLQWTPAQEVCDGWRAWIKLLNPYWRQLALVVPEHHGQLPTATDRLPSATPPHTHTLEVEDGSSQWMAKEELQTNLACRWKINSQSLGKTPIGVVMSTTPPPPLQCPRNEQMFPFPLSSKERSKCFLLWAESKTGGRLVVLVCQEAAALQIDLQGGRGGVSGQVLRTQRRHDRCLFNFSASRVKTLQLSAAAS